MHDKNGTDIIVGDYLAFPSQEGRDIGQVIEINESHTTSNVVVLHVATYDASAGGGVAGILRKFGDALHIHCASTSYVTGNECEVVMLGDGSLPVKEPTKAPDQVPGCATSLPEATTTVASPTSVHEEPGHDANNSPVQAIPVPAG